MKPALSFFQTRQKPLLLLFTAYVVLLLLSHWRLPSAHVWWIAAFFSVVMNFTYLTEAHARRAHVGAEAVVARALICLSILGLAWPPLVILAIFGHGCWDIAKHLGAGVPFFSWYTLSCFAVDTLYSLCLLLYWLQ